MSDSAVRNRLLRELLDQVRETGAYPEARAFRLAHESERRTIDAMVQERLIDGEAEHYVLTFEGLRTLGSAEALAELEAAAELIPHLQEAYRRAPDDTVNAADLALDVEKNETAVARWLTLLSALPICTGLGLSAGLVETMRLSEGILDVSPSDIAPPAEAERQDGDAAPERLLTRIEIDGYRPFRAFVAEPGDLTVIIGANASGKSSLFDFLRFVSRAVQDPLPPEIDERAAGKLLFHGGQPEQLRFALTLDLGQRIPLRYEVQILGPVGAPTVARERLTTTRPLRASERDPFIFLDFAAGRGVVRDQRERKLVRPEWTVKANELALRRALDPTLVTLSRVQGLLAAWRFYSGFDVSATAGMRRPVPSEPDPTLHENGGNLSAMLMWLNREHPDVWDELESHLRGTVPGFKTLNVKPKGGPGTVLGIWREQGVDAELTLADLSDGTLRLLCWAVLCLSPNLPPLLCVDEPELGLHPRVLPLLAGLFKLASARTQVLVSTHSPYLLSHFGLDEIAVMRKEDGAARFVRPSTSGALRAAVEDVGGEALGRLHLSDELETLP